MIGSSTLSAGSSPIRQTSLITRWRRARIRLSHALTVVRQARWLGSTRLLSSTVLSSTVLTAALVLSLGSGCSKKQNPNGTTQEKPSTQPVAHGLPPLRLTDDTPNLLLTWLDEAGDFHVVQKPEEVPDEGKSQVRVVVTDKTEGTGQTVYVADLTKKNEQGQYAVTTMPRSQWNELGAKRRKVRMEAVIAPSASASSKQPVKADGKVSAIIYGADWCKPCHDAENYLKTLGVEVTKKNIEKSRAAQAEMQAKLSKAGRGGASIPVIDVAGKLFVGYNPNALKHAVESALKPEML